MEEEIEEEEDNMICSISFFIAYLTVNP